MERFQCNLKHRLNKIDIYKKLTDPKVNDMLKNKLFEGHYQQYTAGQM